MEIANNLYRVFLMKSFINKNFLERDLPLTNQPSYLDKYGGRV